MNRRDLLKTSSAVLAGVSIPSLLKSTPLHAQSTQSVPQLNQALLDSVATKTAQVLAGIHQQNPNPGLIANLALQHKALASHFSSVGFDASFMKAVSEVNVSNFSAHHR